MSSNNNIAPSSRSHQEGESNNDDDSPTNRRRTIQSFYRRSSGSLREGDGFVTSSSSAPSVILPRRITMEQQASNNTSGGGVGMLRRRSSLRASDNDMMSITDDNNNNGGGEYDSRRSRRNLLSNSTNSNSSYNSNSNSNNNMRLASSSSSRRRRRLDLNNDGSTSRSNNNTLMVSFSRLNNKELQIVRKWNRRLHRTEVFDKYYFPAQWETTEMESIINFLKIEDPFSGHGHGGGGHRSSCTSNNNSGKGGGNDKKNSSMRNGSSGANRSSRRRGDANIRRATTSGTTGSTSICDSNTSGSSSLAASITSSFKLGLGDSADKLSKLLADPTHSKVDPTKVTKEALNFLFFPYVHDPKSVLLKRGSIFIHSSATTTTADNSNNTVNERELMIFTHGFLIANVVLEDTFRIFLALCDHQFVTEKSFLDYMLNKFKEMTSDIGTIEKYKIQKLFSDLGIPQGESILDELIDKCGCCHISSSTSSSNNNNSNAEWATVGEHHEENELINWSTLYKGLAVCVNQDLKKSLPSPNGSFDRAVIDDSSADRDHNSSTGSGMGLKKLLGAFSKEKKGTTKAECAALFSDISRVDCLNVCHGDDVVSREIANSTSAYAQTSFSVTLKGRENDPLIFVCCKPEHRDIWVEAFKIGVIKAMTYSFDREVVELRKKIGWQHLVMRSSLTSLVVLNDTIALECACQDGGANDEGEEEEHRWSSNMKDVRMELNLLDEYNGYSPLHYATILGHIDCMEVLLEAGSKVTLEDRKGESPMYHALKTRNDEAANVLEKYGADRTDDLRKLIQCEIEEQQNDVDKQDGRLETCAETALDNSEAASEAEIDELLLKAVNQLG